MRKQYGNKILDYRIERFRTFRMPKNVDKHRCEKCNFECIKKSEWDRHILTANHNCSTVLNPIEPKIEKIPRVRRTEHICSKCSKVYTARNSLWYHEKKCTFTPPTAVPPEPNWPEIIQSLVKENQELIKDNKELRNAMLEQNKNLTEVIKNQQPMTNSHNNNSHNQNYNINMFLSDKCKDAQNLSEFIEVLKTKVDMMKIGQAGYVNGISKLFIDELNAMEVTERPLHCTDERRNTFYVHNDDAWKKDENLKGTKNAIFHVSQVNVKQCVDWSKHTPEDEDDRNDHVTRSIHLYQEAVKSSDDKHVDKIIKNISKEIPLNKQVIGDVVL